MMKANIQNILLFEGIHISKANPLVIEKLKEQKKLLFSGKLTPLCILGV